MIRAQFRKFALVSVLTCGFCLIASTAPVGASTRSPTCKTVPAADINATIGGGARVTGIGGSAKGVLICVLGGIHNVTFYYRTNQTSLQNTTFGQPGLKQVTGLGHPAESFVLNKQQALAVLVGHVSFVILASKTTVAAEKALAKRMIPLV